MDPPSHSYGATSTNPIGCSRRPVGDVHASRSEAATEQTPMDTNPAPRTAGHCSRLFNFFRNFAPKNPKKIVKKTETTGRVYPRFFGNSAGLHQNLTTDKH